MKKNRMQISTLPHTAALYVASLPAARLPRRVRDGSGDPPQESAAAPETEEPSAQQEDVTLEEPWERTM